MNAFINMFFSQVTVMSFAEYRRLKFGLREQLHNVIDRGHVRPLLHHATDDIVFGSQQNFKFS